MSPSQSRGRLCFRRFRFHFAVPVAPVLGKTVVRTVACESLAELSWLVWDAEDSLEFYPAQASQSFFSLPRSLRPRNRLESRSPGARHLRACPVREVVTVTWDPRPREPVEGVLQATSVLELAATRRTLELRGKRWLGQWRVSRLQSSRGWSGTPMTVSLPSSGRVHVGRRRWGGSLGPRS
ncbi:hypothetical protein Taro_028794 [Colocasia esculenta]|uniref:Uncharacterized protein n=1 Tax=Colocasia esculenta TaxID=4460 RepID=A0A843VRD9_COLES|nr:hypothetical protein [Colocasia esculenta]